MDALAKLENLQVLVLSGNDIGDDGATKIAEALPSMKNLRTSSYLVLVGGTQCPSPSFHKSPSTSRCKCRGLQRGGIDRGGISPRGPGPGPIVPIWARWAHWAHWALWPHLDPFSPSRLFVQTCIAEKSPLGLSPLVATPERCSGVESN